MFRRTEYLTGNDCQIVIRTCVKVPNSSEGRKRSVAKNNNTRSGSSNWNTSWNQLNLGWQTGPVDDEGNLKKTLNGILNWQVVVMEFWRTIFSRRGETSRLLWKWNLMDEDRSVQLAAKSRSVCIRDTLLVMMRRFGHHSIWQSNWRLGRFDLQSSLFFFTNWNKYMLSNYFELDDWRWKKDLVVILCLVIQVTSATQKDPTMGVAPCQWSADT